MEQAGERCSPIDNITASDLPGVLDRSAQHYLRIRQHHGPSTEFFSCPDGEKIKVDGNCVLHAPLYRDDDSLKMLLLINPKKRDSVLAVYFNDKWWGIDDILQSCVPVQQSLKQVQTCGERIFLFVLNCLVCGFMESGDSENGVCFLPHSAGELAKIFWHRGEAVAFYTYKNKGANKGRNRNLRQLRDAVDFILAHGELEYDEEQPVLHASSAGHHLCEKEMAAEWFWDCNAERLLSDFFTRSCPGYQLTYFSKYVSRFLADNHKEQDRLWEVDPPGDWSQRSNIWLQIQLGETRVIKNCSEERLSEHPGAQGDTASPYDRNIGSPNHQLSKKRKMQAEKACETKQSKMC